MIYILTVTIKCFDDVTKYATALDSYVMSLQTAADRRSKMELRKD